ncbi:DUF2202 domain-containing protein [Sulfurovum riftiae]|uniref:DUF2202 domain-containing protein n=1 Tax=Sulfurovum riftiae TaxID=1630136 RepID=A0A151CE96_9BACT|nr:DUF2202 domain-containing protein [Sulfurovum riftiae]KYJ85794.1 hypothetical protein AS592_03380 [Sulfurovum riftiae]
MKKSFLAGTVVMAMLFAACESGSTGSSGNDDGGSGAEEGVQLPANVIDAINAPLSILTQELKDALTYMYSEEGLAHDVYLDIYLIQPVSQLQKIANNAETKHIEAVNQMAIKYDLNMTQYPDTDVPYSIEGIGSGKYPVDNVQYLYDLLYSKGIQSQKDALEVGCMVEVVDIDDLNTYISYAETANASDVLTVFEFLREGSYSHYWAFDKGLKNMGIAEGCCSIPDALGHFYCHPEYPQK